MVAEERVVVKAAEKAAEKGEEREEREVEVAWAAATGEEGGTHRSWGSTYVGHI